MNELSPEDSTPHDRRGFFATGMARLIGPLAGLLERKFPAVAPPLPLLRPPGAMDEVSFLDTCHRCGRCAEACPANAITLSDSADPRLRGTPFVDPDRQACVICDELACMKVCPSGALTLIDRFAIRMGLAVVDHETCVRSTGQQCTICLERCPIKEIAIRLDSAGRVKVIDPATTGQGCTGCGVCQQYCPTTPVKAIKVAANES